MDLSKPGGEDELAKEERRRQQQQAGGSGGGDSDGSDFDLDDLAGGGGSGNSRSADSGWFHDCNIGACDSPCDTPSCDVPDCNCGGCDLLLRLGPLDLGLLRLSTLLAVAALVMPARAGRPLTALIRGYRRWLTRFTPACPSLPSCSTYALTAVQTLGARRGLRAAARRIRTCGRA